MSKHEGLQFNQVRNKVLEGRKISIDLSIVSSTSNTSIYKFIRFIPKRFLEAFTSIVQLDTDPFTIFSY